MMLSSNLAPICLINFLIKTLMGCDWSEECFTHNENIYSDLDINALASPQTVPLWQNRRKWGKCYNQSP